MVNLCDINVNCRWIIKQSQSVETLENESQEDGKGKAASGAKENRVDKVEKKIQLPFKLKDGRLLLNEKYMSSDITQICEYASATQNILLVLNRVE